MNILIIGLSSVVSRRALPALQTLPSIGTVDVATRKAGDPAVQASWTHGAVFADYGQALAKSSAELVYVSLVNSEHERWARTALESGRHVVVDKPAVLGCAQAEALLDLAVRHDRCAAEATVFAYHPQIAALKETFASAGSRPSRVIALFTIPPMDAANYRYRSALGGGSLWDQGPYAAASGRVLFGSEPTAVACQSLTQGGEDVDVAFSTLQVFADGCSLVGHFGFDTAYCNRLTCIGPDLIAELDRAFTTPPDLVNSIRLSTASGASTIETPAADSFAVFFEHVLAAIQSRSWNGLAEDLLVDARTIERLRLAAVKG